MIARIAAAGAMVVVVAGFSWLRSPHDIVEEGNDHFRLGEYAEAAARYEEAAEALPDSPELHLNRGNVAFRTFQFDRAIEHFQLARNTDDVALRALGSYQLGNVKYQQALDAMQSFQDAKTPLREAMVHYRDCLGLDANAEDAQFNLELALLLYVELENQEVQAQRNAEIRDQQTSPNAGQAFEGDSPERRDSEEDARRDQDSEAGASEARQAPEGDSPPAESAVQTQNAPAPTEELTSEDAERMVQVIRERARLAEQKRQEARRARLRDARVEKIW